MSRRNYKKRKNHNYGKGKGNARKVVNAIRSIQSSSNGEKDIQDNFTPQHKFDDFAISDKLKKNIDYKNYKNPTRIQDAAIPKILEGRDLIGIANTGTGKTAAFLIPLVEKVLKDKNQKVLIVTPTRELASQISDELYGFSYEMNIGWAVCIGGKGLGRQMDDLKKKPNFVIGTPGRLKDLANRTHLNLNEFNNVVIDEADRMVDMGFIHDIKFFLSKLPSNRQSLFFSATIPSKVKGIINSFVKNPVTVSVKKSDAIKNITHKTIKINGKISKIDKLHELLKTDEFKKVLVFGRTKRGVQKLSKELAKRGVSTDAIHGNKSQPQRQRVLNDFRADKFSVLTATDVAARGLDVDDISHVINYDLPETYEDYIHRVGRTGRANKKGVAVTFV